jgi:mono/diheme cytochrome c family protein
MENAMGGVGAGRIAALAKNPNLEAVDYPITIVTGGKGPMPWFRGQLSDQQIADAINHVRTHYGNHYKGKVTAADVAERGVPAPPGRER